MALERSYSDLTMIVRPEMRQYQLLDILMEFKFVKLKEARGSKKAKVSGEEARAMSRSEVLALEKVKEKMEEAVAQLKSYRQRLLDKYGSTLRLRSYAVVALGFERVVWKEVDEQ